MSATSMGSSFGVEPFMSTNVSVAKQNGSVSAGSPYGVNSEASAPNSSAAKIAQPIAITPDRHVST